VAHFRDESIALVHNNQEKITRKLTQIQTGRGHDKKLIRRWDSER